MSIEPGLDGFYVEPDCCLLCGVPEDIAPDLFETGEKHCFVKRQPCSQHEIDQALQAMWSSETACVRYSGNDRSVLRRIGEAGLSSEADDPIAATFKPILRNKVTFTLPEETSPASLATAFASDQRKRGSRIAPRLLISSTVRLAWYKWQFSKVRFQRNGQEQLIASISSPAIPGLCFRVDAWLHERGAQDIIWHSAAGIGIDCRATPI